jgi:hypothetical protein
LLLLLCLCPQDEASLRADHINTLEQQLTEAQTTLQEAEGR